MGRKAEVGGDYYREAILIGVHILTPHARPHIRTRIDARMIYTYNMHSDLLLNMCVTGSYINPHSNDIIKEITLK